MIHPMAKAAAEVVSLVFHVQPFELFARIRPCHVSEARHALYTILRDSRLSCVSAATMMGRTHGAVSCGVKRAAKLSAVDDDYNEKLQRVRREWREKGTSWKTA